MFLATALSNCEDELYADFAETYHIYDIYALNVEYAAILARGLRNYSRTYMKLSGDKLNLTDTLLALIVDKLSILVWFNTEDGEHNRNRPKSIYEALTSTEIKEEYEEFKTGADFLEAWENA